MLNGKCTENLFQEHDAGEFMGKRDTTKTESQRCIFYVRPSRPSYDEIDISAQFGKPFGELFGSKHFSG